MTINLLSLAAPAISKATPEIIKLIKNKVSPDEIQQAILAGIEVASAEDAKQPSERHLFNSSKPDSLQGVPGFLGKYLQVAGVREELAKSFKNEGKPNVEYLIEEFKRVAEKYKKVDPVESSIKPWLTNFVEAYFEKTSTFLKFQVAKADYFAQLNKRYDNIKFAGIAVSGQEEIKQLQQIFVMPDVVKIDRNEEPLLSEFIDPDLSQQQKLILEQRQLSRLSNSSQTSLLANKLLTETRSKKAVILGAPGSGKSTLASYFTVMLTQSKAKDLGLDGDRDWLPIVIEIRDLEQNLDLNIFNYLHQFAESNLTTDKLPPDFFQHWLKQGNAVILLDGIDEVADTAKRYRVVEKLNLFLHQYQNNIAIVTSRPSGYKRDFFSTTEFPHYQLQPFNDKKIEEFINHWYDSRYTDPQEAARCKDTLRKALEDNDRIKLLAKNPLLITIIALIHRYQAYLPKERHKLYDKAVETLLTSWDANKAISGHKVLKYLDLDDLRRLLESLARWIHSQGSTGDKEGGTQIDKDDLLSWLSKYIKTNKQKKLYEAREEAERFLSFIRERTGLLNEQGIERYAFVHKTFQEYLCAQDINYEADDEDDFEIVLNCIKNNLHVAHWREVLLLLVAQQKPQKALKAIKAIYENNSEYEQWLHRDLLFAGACLADSPKGTKVKDRDNLGNIILQTLINIEIEDANKIGIAIRRQVFKIISSFVETEWEEQTLNLIERRKKAIPQFRYIEYLIELEKREQAKDILFTLLKEDDAEIRLRASESLQELGQGDTEVIDTLLTLLIKQDDSEVRLRAANSLIRLGKDNTKVTDVLLTLIKADDAEVLFPAAFVLGELGKNDVKVTDTLLTLVKAGNAKIRFRAAELLLELEQGDTKVIDTLLNLLEDDDAELRLRVAESLQKLEQGNINIEVINTLLTLLKDDDADVRLRTAQVLRKVDKSNTNVINTMSTLLKEDDAKVRLYAAMFLRELGQNDIKVTDALLNLTKDDDAVVRSYAAMSLGELGKNNTKVIDALLTLLKDDEFWVRSRAAMVLRRIGKDNTKVINALLALLKDDDTELRLLTAIWLREIVQSDIEVTDTWLVSVKDNNSRVRSSAAKLLPELMKDNLVRNNTGVIDALLTLLKDDNTMVRYNAAMSLREVAVREDREEFILLIVKWIEKHQDTEYIGNGIDALWNLVINDT